MLKKTLMVAVVLTLAMGLGLFAVQAQSGDLEVFSWWTSGGEAAALQALFDAYAADYPDVNIVNATVAGGGGSAARPVLQTRLAGGDPPDSWQVHPGWELIGQYVDPGYVEPINFLYEEEGWNDVVPQGLRDIMTVDGNIYMVLVGVHRGNGFWYNKPLLEANGITIGDTLSAEEFTAAAETLQAAGIAPLCMGDSGIWANAQLFENTLLGTVGPENYLKLFAGEMAWDDPMVISAIESFGAMQAYLNTDHSALSWDQAVKALMDGQCAFNSMGDWAYGEFVAAGMVDNVDFGWVSHPGTAGSFMIVADGFPLANGAPNRDAAVGFLRTLGGLPAQEAFNPLKGSIPARTDADRSKFGIYHNWSMDSFANDALVPSWVHGSAAPAAFQQTLNDAVTLFIVDGDAAAFAASLVQGAVDAGIGGM